MEIKQIDDMTELDYTDSTAAAILGRWAAQTMTEQDFVDSIAKIIGRTPLRTSRRPLYAALSFAHYDVPSVVVIEARGSPPPMTVMVTGLYYGTHDTHCRDVYVNGKRLLPPRLKHSKHRRVCAVVDRFLRSPAFANCLAGNGDAYREHDFNPEVSHSIKTMITTNNSGDVMPTQPTTLEIAQPKGTQRFKCVQEKGSEAN
jgi:hypothetical protein